jgi:hypothetical protein
VGVKFQVNEKFFDTWCGEMAYVLGYFYADGHLIEARSIRARYVCFTSTDQDRIECFKRLLQSDHKILSIDKGGNYKLKYQLRIGSKILFEKLTSLGLTPSKSLSIQLPDVPVEFLGIFIRGYFDGDGCVHIERSKSGAVKKLLTVFTCGSEIFLQELEIKLRKVGLTPRRVYRHGSSKNTYQLRYSSRDSLRLFQLMYEQPLGHDLCMRRKYAIFMEYLRVQALTYETIPGVLETKGPMAK